MQAPKQRSCIASTSSLALTVGDKNSKHDPAQEKLESRLCRLDRMGKPFTPLSGKRVLDRNTYALLKNKAAVVTADERRVAAELHASNEERLKTESENRRAELQKYDTIYRTKGPKLAQVSEMINNFTNIDWVCTYSNYHEDKPVDIIFYS